MSFQYLNPNWQNKPIPYNFDFRTGQNIIPYAQNPIFNQNNLYNNVVYNPLVNPKITQNYQKMGEIKSQTGETAHLYKLSNGHRIIIIPRKNASSVVKTFVNAGSMNETDAKRGVQHLKEHGLFKGSSKLKDGDVFKLTGLMGANTNASTDFAEIKYYIAAPDMDEKDLEKTLSIQGDMIYNPKFDKNAMEAEKGPVFSEISMINDDPKTIAYDKTIRNLFQIQSDSKNLVAGSIETVKNLSTTDLKNYHETYYTPDNMHTTIICDENLDVEKIAANAAKYYKAQKPYTNQIYQRREILTPITNPIREDIKSDKTNNTSVILGFSGPKPNESKDFIIEQMLNFYLRECSSSTLKTNLDKINAEFDSTTQKVGLNDYDPYALISFIETNPNDEQKALDIFYDAIIKLQNTPLSDDEMTAIKNFINKAYVFNICDSENLAELLGMSFLNNSLDLFTNYQSLVNSITKEDIMNYARKYYDLNKVSIVVVHPNNVSDEKINENYKSSKYSMQNFPKKSAPISFGSNKKITTESIEEIYLKNNTHIALNNTDYDICAFNWSINTPPIKPKNPNIPSVLKYMFKKGTDYMNQEELENYMQLNGIDSSVYINGKTIEISANCLSKDCTKTLKLMNDLLYKPKLTENDFIEAKKKIKENLILAQKDAKSNLLDNLYPGYFPTSASRLRTIDKLQYQDILDFYQELLKNASSNFCATAPFEKNPDLKEQIKNYQNDSNNITFKTSTPKIYPIFQANKQPNVVYDTDSLNQAQIFKSYKFPMSESVEQEAKLEMLNIILGGSPNSRLFSDLREKQNLAYHVSSNIQSFENTGILTLRIQTTTDHKDQGVLSYDNVQKSLEGFNKHTKALCETLITDEELLAAKNQLKQNLIGQIQHPLLKTNLLSQNMLNLYGIKRIDKYFDCIDKITKEDIQKTAQTVFSYHPTISILASKDTIDSQMNYLQTQGVVQKAS